MSKFIDLLQQAQELSDSLAEYEDSQLILDNIEGQTDALEWLDWAFDKVQAEKATQAQINERMDALKARKEASKNREQSLKNMAMAIHDAVGVEKIKRPEYTAYVQAGRQSVKVDDGVDLPDEYLIVKKSPDKKALLDDLKQGVVIDGAELVTGDDYIVLRNK